MTASAALSNLAFRTGNLHAFAEKRVRPLAAAYVAACLLSFLPIFWVEHPAVVDFANHAARMFLACQGGDPVVAAMYDYRFGIIPNLALDVVNLPLCGTVAPVMVVKLNTAGALLGIYAAAWLLQERLHGRANSFILLLPALSMNIVTTMGYINYLAGIAIAFFVLLAMLGRREDRLHLLLIGNVGGTLAFFSHIFAFVFLFIAAFGLLLQRLPASPADILKAVLQTVAMFLVPLILVPLVPSGGEPLDFSYGGKVRLLIALFQAQQKEFVFALLLFVPLVAAIREKVLRVSPSLGLPLAFVGLFVLLVPGGIQNAFDVDARLLVPLCFLLFVSLQPIRRERAAKVSVGLVAIAFLAGQLWALQQVWIPFSRDVAEFRRSLDVVPPGARLLSVGDIGDKAPGRTPVVYTHLASYATLDRRVFNPLEFTGTGMQPLAAKPGTAFAQIDTPASVPVPLNVAASLRSPIPGVAPVGDELDFAFAHRWPERFDYVVYYHFGRPSNFAPELLEELHKGSFFSILRIRRPAVPG